jgi:beta-glucanase (GH16 family)
MWPAIWMLGADAGEVGWPACGEIDIMENVGFEPDSIYATVHTGKYNHVRGTQKGSKMQIADPQGSFHVYAVEGDAQKLDFFVDDRSYFTFENEGTGIDVWPFDKECYLILNIAVGGSWGGAEGVDDSIFPQKFCIDYVRAYQRKRGRHVAEADSEQGAV